MWPCLSSEVNTCIVCATWSIEYQVHDGSDAVKTTTMGDARPAAIFVLSAGSKNVEQIEGSQNILCVVVIVLSAPSGPSREILSESSDDDSLFSCHFVLIPEVSYKLMFCKVLRILGFVLNK